MRRQLGEICGYLAYAHPFLETNDRTLMTVHAEPARRAGIHTDWSRIEEQSFLDALTRELRTPGSALDALLAPHVREGALPLRQAAARLADSPALNPGPVSSIDERQACCHGSPTAPDAPTPSRRGLPAHRAAGHARAERM